MIRFQLCINKLLPVLDINIIIILDLSIMIGKVENVCPGCDKEII